MLEEKLKIIEGSHKNWYAIHDILVEGMMKIDALHSWTTIFIKKALNNHRIVLSSVTYISFKQKPSLEKDLLFYQSIQTKSMRCSQSDFRLSQLQLIQSCKIPGQSVSAS